jgi:hypothetical protein
MKPYSVAGHDQFTVAVWLALIAAMISAVLSYFRVPLLFVDFPEKFDSLLNVVQVYGTALTIIAILHFCLNHWLWRTTWLQKYLGVPNLNGNWMGTIDRREYPSLTEEKGLPILVRVKQNYRRIQITLENYDKNSVSGYTSSDAHSINIEGHSEHGCTIHHMFDFSQGSGSSSLRYSRSFQHSELRGTYVSTFPRIGTIVLRQLDSEDTVHRLPIKVLTDQTGIKYLGAMIDSDFLNPYLKQLKKIAKSDFEVSLSNRKKRDGFGHHLTIISPPEFSKMSSKNIKSLEGKKILFALTGFGAVQLDGRASYYVTVFSPHAALLRQNANLGPRDFHVTLGFNPQDIHDHPKDESTWV